MVRPHYRVNDMLQRREELIDVLLTTSRATVANAAGRELAAGQVLPNFRYQADLSRRIGLNSLILGQVFESITRRIVSVWPIVISWASPCRSGPSQRWSRKSRRSPELVATSRLLSDRDHREAALADWLSLRTNSTGLTCDDIIDISRDPPLLLFALFESAHDIAEKKVRHPRIHRDRRAIFQVLARGSELRTVCAQPTRSRTQLR